MPVRAAGVGLEAARAAFAAAKRPMVIAGVDAVNHHAGAALQTFIERFNAPLVTTYKAKGLVAEDHPLIGSLSLGIAPAPARPVEPIARTGAELPAEAAPAAPGRMAPAAMPPAPPAAPMAAAEAPADEPPVAAAGAETCEPPGW